MYPNQNDYVWRQQQSPPPSYPPPANSNPQTGWPQSQPDVAWPSYYPGQPAPTQPTPAPQQNNYSYNPYAAYAQPQPAPTIADVDAAIMATAQAPLRPGQHYSAATAAAAPAKTHGRAKYTLLTLLLAFMLFGGGGALYVFIVAPTTQTAQQSPGESVSSEDAQALFIAMLSQAMDVRTVERRLTIEQQSSDGSAIIRQLFVARSDFSNIEQPKSNVSIKASRQTGTSQTERTGDYVADGTDTFVRLRSATSQPADPALSALFDKYRDKWLQLGQSERSDEFLVQSLLTDGAQLRALNHVASELILVGNVDDTVQEDALAYAFLQQLYTIQSFQATTVDGDKVVEYEVLVKNDALDEYVAAAGAEYGTTLPAGTTTLTVYVSAATGLPRRVEIVRGSAIITVDYSNYNQQLTVEAPSGAKSLPKQ